VDTRTAIVTGASSRIGLALAQAYQSGHRRDPSPDLDVFSRANNVEEQS
jgi:hypothetical protein